MGKQFKADQLTNNNHQMFDQRVLAQLERLKGLIQHPGFSEGPTTLGAELEMYLVDDQTLLPAGNNLAIIDALSDSRLQPELNQFNLEYNQDPTAAQGRPFSAMHEDFEQFLSRLQRAASTINNLVVPIGILPTLKQSDLKYENMTNLPRYQALQEGLYKLRGGDFRINIDGKDPLQASCDSVATEGANTSLQIHLKLPAAKFAAYYNAAQLSTPLVLGLAANSPLLFGHQLWQETRIALFKQSIDCRPNLVTEWRQPTRVSFGQGWVRQGAYELFAENVGLYPAIMPMVEDEPEDSLKFKELCLHHGTVWPWNRAVYGASPEPHLRIEFRSLPSGPTVKDMIANAALAIGWAVGLESHVDEILARLPFQYAEHNFYRAAQSGMEAKILWPVATQTTLGEQPLIQVAEKLLPLAHDGLKALGVLADDIDEYLGIIEQRLQSRQNGSCWQLERLNHYRDSYGKDESLKRMLSDYIRHFNDGNPVATWPTQ